MYCGFIGCNLLPVSFDDICWVNRIQWSNLMWYLMGKPTREGQELVGLNLLKGVLIWTSPQWFSLLAGLTIYKGVRIRVWSWQVRHPDGWRIVKFLKGHQVWQTYRSTRRWDALSKEVETVGRVSIRWIWEPSSVEISIYSISMSFFGSEPSAFERLASGCGLWFNRPTPNR